MHMQEHGLPRSLYSPMATPKEWMDGLENFKLYQWEIKGIKYQRWTRVSDGQFWLWTKYFKPLEEFVIRELIMTATKFRKSSDAAWCWQREKMGLLMLTAAAAGLFVSTLPSHQRNDVVQKLKATRENYFLIQNFLKSKMSYGFSGIKTVTYMYQLGTSIPSETEKFKTGGRTNGLDLVLNGLVDKANAIVKNGIGGPGKYTFGGMKGLLNNSDEHAAKDYAGIRCYWESFESPIVWVWLAGFKPFKLIMYLPVCVKAKKKKCATVDVYKTDCLTYTGLFTLIVYLLFTFDIIRTSSLRDRMIRNFKEQLDKEYQREHKRGMALHGFKIDVSTYVLRVWCQLLSNLARIGVSNNDIKSRKLIGPVRAQNTAAGKDKIDVGTTRNRIFLNFKTRNIKRKDLGEIKTTNGIRTGSKYNNVKVVREN